MKKALFNPKILLLIVVIIWGSGFIAVEYAIDGGYSTLNIMSFRFIVATLLNLLIFNTKLKRLSKSEFKTGFFSGIFIFLAFYFQTLGQKYTNVSNVAFFTATNIVMIPFILWEISKKKPKNYVFLLTLVMIIGVFILNLNGKKFEFRIGDLLTLISAIFFALQVVYLDLNLKNLDPIKVNFVQLFIAGMISTILLIFNEKIIINFDRGILSIVYLGAFSTCLCYLLQTYAQKYIDSISTGTILSLECLFATVFSIILGIDKLTLNIIIGGMLITYSSIMIVRKEEKSD